jgi:alpha-L-rhamnosidase
MGDWLSAFADTPKDVLATAFFAHSADLATRMAALDDDPAEADRLGAIAARARAAFVEHYVADDGTVTGGTQTAYALALRFDLLPAGLRAAAAKHLADDVRARGFHPTVGFVGVPHLLPALTDAGHVEEAYGILLQDTFPSWGYQIANGATTMWERWDGWTAETGFQDPAMNSFNHYAFGAVGEWLYTTVAGIAPDADDPGFRTIRLRPTPGPGLDWARARYTSIRGEVACGWSRGADGTITVDVEVPPTCTADLELPNGERHTLGSGAWSFSC